ncbi:MAG TPA: GEVED domain-containing protein [Bacteroidia bacterium]|nr:GEVED domain-containing protein [Bacteroidia bacterium]
MKKVLSACSEHSSGARVLVNQKGKIQFLVYLIGIFLIVDPGWMRSQVVNTESFDGATFVPPGWTDFLTSGTAVWTRVTAGTFPTQAPHSGAGEAQFNSYSASTGDRALITPPFSLLNNASGAAVSFWMYRDNGYLGTADKIDVYYNTAANLTGATLLGTVNRAINLSPVVGGNGWYQYAYTIPNTVTNTAVYLILRATSAYGNNIFVDDVSWTSYPPMCSGTPASPVAAISSPSGCPGAGILLSATGTSTAAGITFQWQSATSGAGPWSNISGAVSPAFATSTTSTTYYQMVTTCTVSALSATSGVVSYSVVNPGPCVCNTYGASAPIYTGDEEILQVAFGTMNNVSTCASVGPGPGSSNQLYSNYAGFVPAPNACLGAAVPFTVNIGTCNGWYGMSMSIYIDYNQNGVFTDPGEMVYNNTNAIQGNNVGTVTIPMTASTGVTRMRVIALEGTGQNPPSVGAYSTWGETEDYCVNILPSPTITTSGGGSICPGQPFVITGGGASTYTYTSPTGTTSGASTTVSPIVNTTYTVSGTGANGCISPAALMATLTVNSLVSPTLVVSATPTAYCVGGTASLSVSGANTYTWNTASNATMIVVNPSVSTTYTVTGTGTNICNGVKTITLVVNPLPTVAVSPATPSVCSLSTINFTASGASTYTWNGGPSGNTVALTPTTSTVYTVIGTSAAGCTSSLTVPVLTYSLPIVNVSPASASVCVFAGANFTASGAVTYTWNNQVTTPTITVYQSANTNYTVTGSSPDGCKTSATVAVTTYSLPVLSLTPNFTTSCPNFPVTVSVTGASTYTWSDASTSTSAVFTPSAPMQYTVTGTNALGCTSSTTGIINTFPSPTITLVPASATVCSTSSVSIAASGANTYTWSTGSNSPTVTLSPSVNTTYSVSATETVNNCASTKTITVFTNSLPVITVAQSGSSVCVGSEATFTANGASTYTWSTGTVGNVMAITPSVASTYTVNGTSSQNCSSSKTLSIGLYQLPVVTILPANNVSICVGESITFTASGGNTYAWIPGTTTGAVFSVSPQFSPDYYTVTVTDNNGCKNEGHVVIRVYACTGLAEINAGEDAWIELYPNPSNGAFRIDFGFEGKKELNVLNQLGQVVFALSSEKLSENLDLGHLTKGVYYLRVSHNKQVQNVKILIE